MVTLPTTRHAEVMPAAARRRVFPFSFQTGHALMVFLVLGGCSATGPGPKPSASTLPKANVNLSGYPLEFRQGYADGCVSAGGRTVRNEARMKADVQYALGWRDGQDICRRR